MAQDTESEYHIYNFAKLRILFAVNKLSNQGIPVTAKRIQEELDYKNIYSLRTLLKRYVSFGYIKRTRNRTKERGRYRYFMKESGVNVLRKLHDLNQHGYDLKLGNIDLENRHKIEKYLITKPKNATQ